jgi:hypothetical protein
LTHPDWREEVEERFAGILAAKDWVAGPPNVHCRFHY